MNNSDRIPTIAVTGGPCAGKTTILSLLHQHLADKGITVFTVPEVATLLMSGGVTPNKFGREFQSIVLRTAMDLENRWLEVAKAAKAERKVVVCDRGAMDCKAYMEPADFTRLIKSEGLTVTHLRDERYDGVIHLRTAALGAEDFYTLANNQVRTESPQKARLLDERTLEAWIGHPHLRVIENKEGGFEQKKRDAVHQVFGILGYPEPLEIERKYLVKQPAIWNFPVPYQTVKINQHYLKDGSRIRQRGQDGSWNYYLTKKQEIRPGVRIEIERQIDSRQFQRLLKQRDQNFHPVRKRRHCFVYRSQYFELDVFSSPRKINLLELELTKENDQIELPPFIQVVRDVTEDKLYSNREIARIRGC